VRLFAFVEIIAQKHENLLEELASIRHGLVADRSESPIQSDEYLFMDSHLTQILSMVLSNDMERCLIERAIRATSRIKNYVYSSMQVTYDA
jgi:hypothetical protein